MEENNYESGAAPQTQPQTPVNGDKQNYSYGKRPLWQWILLYIVIGAIVYGAIYYFFFMNKGGYNYQSNNTNINNYMVKNMKVEILKEGSGEASKIGDKVTVDYVGTLTDGTKFDSSIDRGTPFSFVLGENRVIQGWELGLLGMQVGEKIRLTIPPELAYGSQGVSGAIPPNATLIFEIDLLKIN